MVVVGGFKVQLVDAVTKEPFKEHTGDDGQFYAETEPDSESFIQVEVLEGKTNKTKYCFEFDVDGTDLGYLFCRSKACGQTYKGLWS